MSWYHDLQATDLRLRVATNYAYTLQSEFSDVPWLCFVFTEQT